jgi:hypothetical protein
LSGADYPIKSNDYLFSFFENADKEYIAFWRLEDRPSWLPKVQHYYFIDAIPIRDWSNNRERVYWRRLFWGRFAKVSEGHDSLWRFGLVEPQTEDGRADESFPGCKFSLA